MRIAYSQIWVHDEDEDIAIALTAIPQRPVFQGTP